MNSMVIETEKKEKFIFFVKNNSLRTILPNKEEVIVNSLNDFSINDKLFFYYQSMDNDSVKYYLDSYPITKITSLDPANRFITIVLNNNNFIDFIIDEDGNLIAIMDKKKFLVTSLKLIEPNIKFLMYYYDIVDEKNIEKSANSLQYFIPQNPIYAII